MWNVEMICETITNYLQHTDKEWKQKLAMNGSSNIMAALAPQTHGKKQTKTKNNSISVKFCSSQYNMWVLQK